MSEYSLDVSHFHMQMKKLEYQKIELTMKVGKHSATVVCKNKKTAKQRASQAILQVIRFKSYRFHCLGITMPNCSSSYKVNLQRLKLLNL